MSQLCHPDLNTDFPPIRSLSALPNNLPPQLTSFVGRDSEIAEIQGLLDTSRLVTLTGAGGCGKTRLAIHVAAEASDKYRDGVWWVDLAPIADPALVPSTVAKALVIRNDSNEGQTTAIEQATKDSSLLIVLNNCEHLVDATTRLAERLSKNSTLLATSREPLGLAGEHAYRVPTPLFDHSPIEQVAAIGSRTIVPVAAARDA
jgi:predicted ATPase